MAGLLGIDKSSKSSSATTVDPKLMALYQQNYNTAQGVANRPYQPYTGDLTAGLNAQQLQSAGMFGDIANNQTGAGTLDQAIQAAQSTAGYQPQALPTDYAAPAGYSPSQVSGPRAPMPVTGPRAPTNVSAPGISATSISGVPQATTNYNAPQLSTGYSPTNITPTGVNTNFSAPSISANYSPTQVGSPGNVSASSVSSSYSPNTITAGLLSGTDLNAYMNPYTQQVVNTTQADIERQRQLQRVADSQKATAAKAFGGSRSGVADSLTNEAALRTSASTLAALRSQGFTDAQAQAQLDLNRKLAADQSNQSAGLTGNAQNQNAQIANQNAGLTAQTTNASNALDVAKTNQSAGLAGASLNQTAGLANLDAAIKAQQLGQTGELANQGANLTAQTANQTAGLNAANLNQQGGIANLDAAIKAQQLGQTGELANQSTGLSAAVQNQQAALDAAKANQGASLTAQTSNQNANLQTQGLSQAAKVANQGAGLQTAALGQTAQIANQNANLSAAQLNTDSALKAAGINLQAMLANQGASLSAAQLRQQGGAALANMSDQELNDAIARAQGVNQAGNQAQATDQAALDAQYQQFLNQWNYPLQQQQIRNSALGIIPQQTTTTQTKTPGLLDYLGTIASAVGGAKSAGSIWMSTLPFDGGLGGYPISPQYNPLDWQRAQQGGIKMPTGGKTDWASILSILGGGLRDLGGYSGGGHLEDATQMAELQRQKKAQDEANQVLSGAIGPNGQIDARAILSYLQTPGADPKRVEAITRLMPQAKPQEAFTLRPDESRYDPTGKLLASGPTKPQAPYTDAAKAVADLKAGLITQDQFDQITKPKRDYRSVGNTLLDLSGGAPKAVYTAPDIEQTRGSQGGAMMIPGVGVAPTRFRGGDYEYVGPDGKWTKVPGGAVPTSVQTDSPGQKFDWAEKLRDDYQKSSSDFKTQQQNYGRLSSSDATPAGDLALIYSYMKLLDPGSVVRESEFGIAATAKPLLDRLGVSWDAVKNVWEGKRLVPSQRTDFLKQAQNIYSQADAAQNERDAQYGGLAQKYGIEPEKVITGIRTPKAIKSQAAGGLPAGVTDEDVDFTAKKYGISREQVLQRLGGK